MSGTTSFDKLSPEQRLRLDSVIGFGGSVNSGLHVHPDGKHLIYPLGSTVIIRDIANSRAGTFLQGHSDKVSCIAVSPSGRYIASGQTTHMGFQADVILWDFETRTQLHRMTLHKVKVQALSFSSDERFLASVGGQDDNTLVVWDVETGAPVCGGAAASDLTICLSFFGDRNDMLITGGNYLMRVWEIDFTNRKIRPTDVNMGQLKRITNCIVVDKSDEYAYCGTTTGDILCVQLQGPKNFKYLGPKGKLGQGVQCITLGPRGQIVAGSGDGTIAVLRQDDLTLVKSTSVLGGVTSISFTPSGEFMIVGTSQSNIYAVKADTLEAELRSTCHFERINDVAYPKGYSELFATCSANDIRVWNARSGAELLRIQVPSLECNCVTFNPEGTQIISGWSDGKIRAFGPQSGKLLFTIHDAHRVVGQRRVSGHLAGVTAIACSHDSSRLVSGGSDGQVRVWRVTKLTQTMEASMKEHKATINTVQIRANDSECITSSDDGSCIVWDLNRFLRNNIIYAQTYFRAANYFVDESQVLTAGSDRKITFWDSYDCSAIREMEGSKGEINTIDISEDGSLFISAGSDKVLKTWSYDEGELRQVGVGHSGVITKARISPDQKNIVSIGEEGAIFIWRLD